MKNTVITYYADISEVTYSKNNKQLLDTWSKNWTNKGWHCVVLTAEDAKLHKDIEHIDVYNNNSLLVRDSHLNKTYLWNCYLRWFAYSKYVEENGTCVWSDFDVMNCNLTPDQMKQRNILPDTTFDGSLCCGVLSPDGSRTVTKNINLLNVEDADVIKKVNAFFGSRPDRDLNDMILLRAINVFKIHFMCTSLMIKKEISQEKLPFEVDGTYKFEAFPLIHFHHGLFSNSNFLRFPHIKSKNRTDIVNYFFDYYLKQPIF